MEGVGETVLEILPAAPNVEQSLPPTLHISSKLPVKTSFSASSSSSSSSKEIPSLGIFKASLKDKCVDLKNVKYVDVHRTSRTFPHAFIVHRLIDVFILNFECNDYVITVVTQSCHYIKR